MGYSPQETKVQRTFDKAMDQINNLQKVFRDEGMMAKAVVDIGGNQDFGAIQEAFDNLYGALEDAHYDAMAHIDVESAKQKLGMDKEPVAEIQTGDDVKEDDEEIQAIPAKVVELAGDSIWDRDGSNPKSVKVSKVSIQDPYGGSDPYMSDDEDDGYRKVDVEHDGPWSIYTDSGFEKAISKMVGFEVSFTEQGMQEDGMASMEGTMGDKMESVNVTEGYESKVLGILKKEGSRGWESPDNEVYVPIMTASSRIFGTRNLRSINVKIPNNSSVEESMLYIEQILRVAHDIGPGQQNDFRINDWSQYADLQRQATAIFTALLTGIASISLLVGGIGVMNIMLVSVTERTKEIGIRRALGATPSEVRSQIILESVFLTVLSGLIGIILGALVLYGINAATEDMTDFPYTNPTVPIPYVLGALFLMIVLGTLIGIIPAQKAVSIKPIEALREE